MKRYNSTTETSAHSRKVGPDITSLVLSIFSSKKDAKVDKARMQAMFNALAMLFLLIGACVAAAVYYVLQPFLHVLLWAILTGTFLHPFKLSCTTQLNAWLLSLEESNLPLTFGLLLSPLYAFNWASTSLLDLILTHWVALASSTLGLAALWALLTLGASAYDGFEVTYSAITQLDVVLAQTRWLQLCTLVAGFVILLLTVRRRVIWRVFFLSLWVCLAVNVGSYFLGPVIIPIVAMVMALGCIIAFHRHVLCETGDEDTFLPRAVSSIPSHNVEDGINSALLHLGHAGRSPEMRVVVQSELHGRAKKAGEEERGRNTTDGGEQPIGRFGEEHLADNDSHFGIASEDHPHFIGGASDKQHRHVYLTSPPPPPQASTATSGSRETCGNAPMAHSEEKGHASPQSRHYEGVDDPDFGRAHRKAPHSENSHPHHSASIFITLISVCTVVVLWTYPILFYAFIPSCIWLILKHLCSGVFWSKGLACIVNVASSTRMWADVILPLPLSSLVRVFVSLDQLLVYVLKASLGSLVSVHIILGLVLTVVGGAFLLGFQMQVELRHFGSVVMSIWNTTVSAHPNLSQWSEHANETSPLGPFFVEGYEYGRTWLVSKIQMFVSDHIDNSSVLGESLLHLYDNFYHSYFLKNVTPPAEKEVTYDDNVFYDNRMLLWSEIKAVIKGNWETVMALWSLLSNNVALIANNLAVVASFVTGLLSALLRGGSALINMFVFFTALYYVLSLSEDTYLPTSWVMDFVPLSYNGRDLGEVLSRAIRSVFHASLQRAFFYGLYTWVVHTILNLPVSVLPAVLAAIAGAIPFVGPYWAALPAAVELWLVEKQLILALCLVGLLLLPYLLLDNILYEEVEGAHPYLTGLAVAGGIYFAGLEGAIIGPILLCCLVFVKELYNSLCDQIELGDGTQQPHQQTHRPHDYSP